MKEKPVNKRQRNKATNPYKEEILKLELAGNTVKEIYSTIQKQGYSGTFSALRILVQNGLKTMNGPSSSTYQLLPRKKKSVISTL